MPEYLPKNYFIRNCRYRLVFFCIGTAFLFFFFTPCNYPLNLFGNLVSSQNNSLIFHGIAHAKNISKPDQIEWNIRLSIEMPSKGLKDSMNTLGVSPGSSVGQDLLDIVDLPRPPWVKNYLELVFPHPEWDGELTDLSSDFRSANSEKEKVENWFFEVRSNILNEEIIFSWHGPAKVLSRCQLRDGMTGKLLASDPLKEGYTFKMTKPAHLFIWEYTY
mgnify:CR=1 FL=1